MANAERTTNGGLALRWVLLSALGLAGGIAVALRVAGPVEAVVGMMLVTPITLALAGSALGVSQWMALGRWHRAGMLWIGACAAALAVGMTSGIVFVEIAGRAITGEPMRLFTDDPVERFLSLAVIGAVTGLAVGAATRLAVRSFRPAVRGWVRRCVAAFGLGLPGGGLAADLFLGGLQSAAGLATFLVVAGLTVGALTARIGRRVAAALALHGRG